MKTHLIFLWFITFGVMACTSQPGINTGENKVEYYTGIGFCFGNP